MGNMQIRTMKVTDYEKFYALWMSCKNMGFNDIDDSNWEKQGFIIREDVNYRNIGLRELVRIDT